MGQYYPQYVDVRKSTIGGLPIARSFAKPWGMTSDVEAPEFAEIGRRLEAVRAGFTELSQRDFATFHGFNPSQYNNWAKGVRRIPVEAAEQLSDAYGLSLDWIYRNRRDGLTVSASKVI